MALGQTGDETREERGSGGRHQAHRALPAGDDDQHGGGYQAGDRSGPDEHVAPGAEPHGRAGTDAERAESRERRHGRSKDRQSGRAAVPSSNEESGRGGDQRDAERNHRPRGDAGQGERAGEFRRWQEPGRRPAARLEHAGDHAARPADGDRRRPVLMRGGHHRDARGDDERGGEVRQGAGDHRERPAGPSGRGGDEPVERYETRELDAGADVVPRRHHEHGRRGEHEGDADRRHPRRRRHRVARRAGGLGGPTGCRRRWRWRSGRRAGQWRGRAVGGANGGRRRRPVRHAPTMRRSPDRLHRCNPPARPGETVGDVTGLPRERSSAAGHE